MRKTRAQRIEIETAIGANADARKSLIARLYDAATDDEIAAIQAEIATLETESNRLWASL